MSNWKFWVTILFSISLILVFQNCALVERASHDREAISRAHRDANQSADPGHRASPETGTATPGINKVDLEPSPMNPDQK